MTNKVGKTERLPFRWSYFVLPSAIFLLTLILAAFFYPQLPAEVVYHFKSDGSPDKWLSREIILIWILAPQLCLTLLAGAIVWGITRVSTLCRQVEGKSELKRIISVMGNMIGLPQLIICFAMLDIFSYNSYGIHIMPIWIFALITMGLGTILLGIFFIQAIRRIVVPPNKSSRSNSSV
ncbi:MAG: hypothetical protein DRI01_09515 [Chloroflexi bacterium]|nr:MAG: hypothetical protein DRI01_09515 [Chloroflexota bacterium]